jgi:DNA-binding NarL/FixJ family response regulator
MKMMKVIIADDSDLILDRLQQILSQFEQIVIVGSFRNGTEALEGMRLLEPDLAILDFKMPGLNGIEVLKEFRKENVTTKIIILTFYATDYYRLMASKAGADYFYSKVDDFEKIELAVGNILEK